MSKSAERGSTSSSTSRGNSSKKLPIWRRPSAYGACDVLEEEEAREERYASRAGTSAPRPYRGSRREVKDEEMASVAAMDWWWGQESVEASGEI